MKRLIIFMLVCCLMLFRNPAALAQEARPELRAFWADGFNPGYKTPDEVDQLLQRVHEAHCNAVFAQMRKGGDAYYASHYEPRAKDDPSHFDALACLIKKAHAMRPPIAVHAWINTCAVGGNGSNPFNIAHLHPDWLSLDPKNRNFDGEATKIDPGNPDAADWTFRVYLDIARRYNVDGIHFDFVRYGGREWGYNPVSVARFQQRYGHRAGIKRLAGSDLPDPADPTWKQWRRDQVTNLVRKVYVHAVQVNPQIVVSAAVIAWADSPHSKREWATKSAAMNRVYQDWRSWLQEGMIDLACPMTYFQSDHHADWQRHWSEYIKNHQYGRAATVGVGTWFNTIPQSLEQIKIARQTSGTGHRPYGVMLYSYAGTNAGLTKDAKGKRKELTYQTDYYAALRQYFPADVPPPPMPWKTQPQQGHLKGFALTADLKPIDGATVTAQSRGRTYARQTDGTGFYALIGLPPGDYTIKISTSGYEVPQEQAVITAGQVTTMSFTLGASFPMTPSLKELENLPANGTPVRLEKLRVILGTDTFPGNLYVLDAQGVGMRVRLLNPPLLPFQPGDIVSVTGTWLRVEGEPTMDRAQVRLTDMARTSTLPAPKAVTGKQLAAGSVLPGNPVTVQGSVIKADAEGFTLDDGGVPLRVPLAGRKEFGVESSGLNISPPVVGTQVVVTGILSRAEATSDAPALRLHPLDSTSVKRLPDRAFWQKPWIGVAASFLFFVLLMVWIVRAKRGKRSS